MPEDSNDRPEQERGERRGRRRLLAGDEQGRGAERPAPQPDTTSPRPRVARTEPESVATGADTAASPEGPGAVPAGVAPPDARVALANRLAARVLLLIVLVVLEAGLIVRYLGTATPGLTSDVALDYATVARSLATGEGFKASYVRPVATALGFGVDDQPELTRAPLFPAIVALYFRFRNTADTGVLLCSALGLLLCAAGTYLLAARLYHAPVGLLAAVFVLFSPALLDVATTGSSALWVGGLIGLALAAAAPSSILEPEAEPGGPRAGAPWKAFAGAALAGVCFGSAYLAEYAVLLVLIPMIFLVRAVPDAATRRTRLLVFVCGFLLPVLPWWVRNIAVAHNPLLCLDRYAPMLFTSQFPGATAYRSLGDPGNPYLFLLRTPSAFIAAVMRNASGVSQMPGWLPGAIPGVLAIAAFFFRPVSPQERVWRRFLLGALAALLAFTIALPFSPTNYVGLAPLAAVLGAATLFRLLAPFSKPWRLLGWVAVTGLVLAAPLERALLAPPARPSPAVQEAIGALQLLQPNAVVATDVPWLVAWYGDRPTVWLPTQPGDLGKLFGQSQHRPGAILLSQGLMSPPPLDDGLAPYRQWVADVAAKLTAREKPPQELGGVPIRQVIPLPTGGLLLAEDGALKPPPKQPAATGGGSPGRNPTPGPAPTSGSAPQP